MIHAEASISLLQAGGHPHTTARTPAASPSSCAWAGIAPCTASRRRRRRSGPCWSGASSCRASSQDVELSIRGILRGFGLKLGEVSKGRFAARVRELVAGQPMLERVVEPMLRAREALRAEYQVPAPGGAGASSARTRACRRLMTVPGVGALVAVTFTSAVDDPARFRRSRAVGAHFGLTPKKYQSGRDRRDRRDQQGRATRWCAPRSTRRPT